MQHGKPHAWSSASTNRKPVTESLMKFVADDVKGTVVPAAGHWLMEENPEAMVKIVQDFLA